MASARDPRCAGALQAALHSRGLEVDDFALEEESASDLADSLGLSDAVLKVRCRSTGEERLYSGGLGSVWLGVFLMELDHGHFARGAVRRPHGWRRLQRPAPYLDA